MLFDEFAARFDVVSHQHAKDLIGGRGVFHCHLQQKTILAIHAGFPQFFGVHLAQTFETRDPQAAFAHATQRWQQFPETAQPDAGIFVDDFKRIIRLAIAIACRSQFVQPDSVVLQLPQRLVDRPHFMQVINLQILGR